MRSVRQLAKVRRLPVLLVLLATAAVAQNWNTWQSLVPERGNASSLLNKLPQPTHLIFRADMTSGVTPYVGAAGTFTRNSKESYYTGLVGNVLATAGIDSPAVPAYAWGGSGTQGLYVGGARKNWNTRSSSLSTAPLKYTATAGNGGIVADSVVASPDGLVHGGLMTSNVADGGWYINTDLTASASLKVIVSAYVYGGTVPLSMYWEVCGSSDTGNVVSQTPVTVPVGPPYSRLSFYAQLPGTASGTVRMTLRASDSSAVFLTWGWQIESPDEATYGSGLRVPSAYIPTTFYFTGNTTLNDPNVTNIASTVDFQPGQIVTGSGIPASTVISSVGTNSIVLNKNATGTQTAVPLVANDNTVASAADSLVFPNTIITTTARTTGTLCMWVNKPYAAAGMTRAVDYWFDMGGELIALAHYSGAIRVFYNGGNTIASVSDSGAYSANTWTHWCATWSNPAGTVTGNLYQNGSLVGGPTDTVLAVPSAGTFLIGQRSSLITSQGGEGIYGRIRIWDAVLTGAEVAQVYAAEKGFYR